MPEIFGKETLLPETPKVLSASPVLPLECSSTFEEAELRSTAMRAGMGRASSSLLLRRDTMGCCTRGCCTLKRTCGVPCCMLFSVRRSWNSPPELEAASPPLPPSMYLAPW